MALAAQEPPAAPEQAAPVPSSTLLIRLKAQKLPLAEAQAIAQELQLREIRVRLSASTALQKGYERQQKDYDKAREQALQRVEHGAAALQRQLLGRKGAAKVEELRKQSLQLSRQNDLGKATIHDAIDPLVDQLRALLLPTPDQLLAADDEAKADIDALGRQHGELRQWWHTFTSMTADIEPSEDVDRHFRSNPLPAGPGTAESIDADIAYAAFAGLPMSDQDHKCLAANAALRGQLDAEEFAGTLALNRIRYLLGLPMVRIDEKLGDAARDHSHDMHTLGFFSHTSPVEGKQSFGMRASKFGTSASAENIAAGQSTGEGAIRAWWYSPGHHRNMLGNHRRTGLGRHEQMWTQMFGG